jgi:hypothetical protein
MVTGLADTEARLLAIARGEQPVQDLDSIGVSFTGDTGRRVLRSPGAPIVQVSWSDLALGFLHHYGRDSLEPWASFVLMAEYEFPEERDEEAERFLESLHDAANGWPVSPGADETARRLGQASLG